MKYKPLNINENERKLLVDILLNEKQSSSYSDTPTRRAGTRMIDTLLKRLDHKEADVPTGNKE